MEPTFHEYYPLDEEKQRAAVTMGRYTDKWSLFVILLLREGPQRFNAIKRSLRTISQQVLSTTLAGMERDGIVVRTVLPTTPPGVEYRLSDLGHSLAQPFLVLGQWILDNMPAIEEAQQRYDERIKAAKEL
jgi:DNA-binding HxlR family transcriptional regulator